MMKILCTATLLICVSVFGAEPCTKPGELCRLKNTGIKLTNLEWTPTAADVASYDELKKAMKASDSEGLAQMVQAGKVFLTSSGDFVRVLDISVWNGYSEVRITSGKYKGTKAITASGWWFRDIRDEDWSRIPSRPLDRVQ